MWWFKINIESIIKNGYRHWLVATSLFLNWHNFYDVFEADKVVALSFLIGFGNDYIVFLIYITLKYHDVIKTQNEINE